MNFQSQIVNIGDDEYELKILIQNLQLGLGPFSSRPDRIRVAILTIHLNQLVNDPDRLA